MKELFFDTPLWLLGVLLIGGLSVWWSGTKRQDKTLKAVGIVIALLGVGLCITSYFFETDREYVTNRTRRLVYSVGNRDWNSVTQLSDPQTSMAWYHNRDELLAGAKATADQIGLKSVRITGTDVQKADTVINVFINVYSEQDRTMGRPVLTSWRFDWQNLGSGWKLRTITPIKSQQVDPSDVMKHLAPPR